MWKKSEDQPQSPNVQPAAPAPTANRPGPIATLGPSIVIKGDLTGEEDLVIEGRVEGEIRLTKNSVTIGKNGRVRADIYGNRVHVDGEVRGNLYGDREIVIRASGRVQGNLISPRVTLENGSKFKGSIDMEPAKDAEPAKKEQPQKQAQDAGPAKQKGDKPLQQPTVTHGAPKAAGP